jgi:hypothetical protein
MLTLSIIAYMAIGLIWGICDMYNAVEVDENEYPVGGGTEA